MNPAAANPSPTPNFELNQAPAGVVLPPRDIRAIVEKTAGYVARNGQVFEQRIREKEKHNPKFSFLNPADSYSPFYLWRLEEIRAGRGTTVSAGRAADAAVAPEPEKPKGPEEPPEFRFSARMPNISAQDLDILRLTALFVAKNGRQFMTTLSQREARNYQFDFLRPNHSFYQYFTRLVDQYTELLSPKSAENMKLLEKNVNDKYDILERARKRAEWSKFQEAQKKKAEEEDDAEKLAYAQIDWHDFVVVETVLFTEADDAADLPPPTSLSDLQHASLEQKAMMSLHSNQLRIEEAMPTSEPEYYQYPTHQPQQTFQLPHHPSQPPQQQQPDEGAMDVEMEAESDNEDEEMSRIRERREAMQRQQQAQAEAKGGAAPMKIRSDYVPKAAAAAASRRGVQMAVCPNCQDQIPLNEMQEHMRIELLDPRWKEQRARAEARSATTNLAVNDAAANLKRLASQRGDLFDDAGKPIPQEEMDRRKRAATGWDGHADSREAAKLQQLQNVNIQEQIENIHKKHQALVNPVTGPKR
ncbi:Pre-mRNA splicing factor PRP21 like protein-domain-containing protein [Peziza echinospora]|nr:Pre-mRNA splicing factor PRP21 like protein-domain-containing protein [Peziza echinospora]